MVISVSLLIMGAPAPVAGEIIYVDAAKNGDGSSWANAYRHLQDALSVGANGDEIWVAQGIYKPDRDLANPDGTGDRAATFQLKIGVGIYGGFPAGGGAWENRDPNLYETQLAGDLNGDDLDFTNNVENSYHVVTAEGVDATAVLDGLTITGGNADSGGAAGYGGGMCIYQGSPTLTDCTFTVNSAKRRGGAIHNKQSSPIVTNCEFSYNYASTGGGAMYDQNSTSTVINCLFIDNSTGAYGGAVYNGSASSPTLTNCTFTGNSADSYGGAIANNLSGAVLTNCIVWGNTALDSSQAAVLSGGSLFVSYCDLEGSQLTIYTDGTGTIVWGGGNIDDDPRFKPDNYHLQPNSPCIDAGDPDGDYSGQTDLDGEPRVMGWYVDMGCDEVLPPPVNYVDDDAPDDPGPGNPDISDPLENGSAAHPFDSIQEAINETTAGTMITVIVLDGTYTGTGNYDIDLGGKAVTVCSLNGPDNCIIDCEGLGRGFDFHSGETQETILEGFTITNGLAEYGGAIRCVNADPQIKNCVITGNTAVNQGGGIYCNLSTPVLADCTISNNNSDGIWTEGEGALLVGTIQITSNDLAGNGTLHMGPDTIIYVHDSSVLSSLSGPGTIQSDINTTLIIGGDAVVDLGNPDDPNANGQIVCHGPLEVKDSAQILNGNITVTFASFEDNTTISSSAIVVNSVAPYGQIFVGSNVIVADNVIFADGDRYMNLNPVDFGGLLQNNFIYVTITEGIGETRGALFELRG